MKEYTQGVVFEQADGKLVYAPLRRVPRDYSIFPKRKFELAENVRLELRQRRARRKRSRGKAA